MDAVEIVINASTKEAEKSLSAFANSATSSLSKVEDAFGLLKTAAIAAVGIIASGKIIHALEEAANAASKQEDAINSLNIAMASAGRYSEQASSSFEKFANKIEETTGLNDDLVISQLAVAQTFAKSNEQAQKLVEAAIQLSAATGHDLQTSVEALGKSLQGTEGSLGKMLPTVKGLTEAQLKHGEAINFVLSRFGGVAEGKLNSFSGALAGMKNAYEQLEKSIGNIIIKNPILISLISEVRHIFEKLADIVKENQSEITKWIKNGILLAIDAFTALIPVIKAAVGFIGGLISGFVVLYDTIKYVVLYIKNFGTVIENVFLMNLNGAIALVLAGFKSLLELLSKLKNLPGLDSILGKSGIDIEGIISDLDISISKFTTNAVGSFDKIYDATGKPFENLSRINDTMTGIGKGFNVAQDLAEDLSDAISEVGDSQVNASKKAAEALQNQFKALKMLADEQRKLTEEGVKNPLLTPAQATEMFPRIQFEQNSTMPTRIGQGVGGIASILKGAEGASSLISSTLGTVADAFLPGIGGAVTEIVKVFAQGPDKVKEMVTQFLDALPVIIQNIIESVPELIETLADKLPDIIDKLVEKLPDIIEKLVEKSPKIIQALVLLMPKVAYKFATALIEELPRIVEKLVEFILKALALGVVASLVAPFAAIVYVLYEVGKFLYNLFDSLGPMINAAMEIAVEVMKGLLSALLNRINQAFSEILNQINAWINDIFNGLNDILQRISDFITNLPQTLANAAQGFVQGIIDGAGKFIEAIVNGIRDAIENILPGGGGSGLGGIGGGKGISIGIPGVGGISIGSGGASISTPIGGISVGGGGGGLGVSGNIGGVNWSFADGGIVPPGFPNDTGIARISSGELVVPTDRVGQLFSMMDQISSGNIPGNSQDIGRLISELDRTSQKQLTVNLVIGEKELASAMLDLNRRGFRMA